MWVSSSKGSTSILLLLFLFPQATPVHVLEVLKQTVVVEMVVVVELVAIQNSLDYKVKYSLHYKKTVYFVN